MSLRWAALAATAVAGMAVTTTFPGAATAEAAPTGCYAYTSTNGAYARCSGGTGQVRVVASCAEDPLGVVRYGPWVGPNLNSIVFCSALAAGYQTRG